MSGDPKPTAAPMTPAEVTAYVNHKVVEFLEGLAQDFDQIKKAARAEGAKVDATDAHNCSTVARQMVRTLKFANTAVLSADPHQVVEVGRAQVPVVQGDGEAQELLEAATLPPGGKAS